MTASTLPPPGAAVGDLSLLKAELARVLPRRTPSGPIVLLRGEMRWIERPRQGDRVRCISGCVWLTHDRQDSDIVLSAGETYDIRFGSRMGISAFDASSVEVTRLERHCTHGGARGSSVKRLLALLAAASAATFCHAGQHNVEMDQPDACRGSVCRSGSAQPARTPSVAEQVRAKNAAIQERGNAIIQNIYRWGEEESRRREAEINERARRPSDERAGD